MTAAVNDSRSRPRACFFGRRDGQSTGFHTNVLYLEPGRWVGKVYPYERSSTRKSIMSESPAVLSVHQCLSGNRNHLSESCVAMRMFQESIATSGNRRVLRRQGQHQGTLKQTSLEGDVFGTGHRALPESPSECFFRDIKDI